MSEFTLIWLRTKLKKKEFESVERINKLKNFYKISVEELLSLKFGDISEDGFIIGKEKPLYNKLEHPDPTYYGIDLLNTYMAILKFNDRIYNPIHLYRKAMGLA